MVCSCSAQERSCSVHFRNPKLVFAHLKYRHILFILGLLVLFIFGNPRDIKNYRPNSLQSNSYKIFTSLLQTRTEQKTVKYKTSPSTMLRNQKKRTKKPDITDIFQSKTGNGLDT